MQFSLHEFGLSVPWVFICKIGVNSPSLHGGEMARINVRELLWPGVLWGCWRKWELEEPWCEEQGTLRLIAGCPSRQIILFLTWTLHSSSLQDNYDRCQKERKLHLFGTFFLFPFQKNFPQSDMTPPEMHTFTVSGLLILNKWSLRA